jgi:hypothetical protein
MFMGIRSHHSAGRVRSYADAQRVFANAGRTPTGKARRPIELACAGGGESFPLGLTKRGQTRVIRYGADESIAFRLYETDVVTWHPDGSVAIENFGTVTTSGFASNFAPFHLYHPVTRRGGDGGHKGIGYAAADGTRRICWGGAVRFRPDGDGWTPDQDTLDTIDFPVLDRRASRALPKRFNLADFRMWLSMAPRHLDIEHQRFDVGTCLDALEQRDFRKAAAYLPLIESTAYGFDPREYALPITTRSWQTAVTMGSVDKLLLAARDYEGCYDRERFTDMDRAEFDKCEAQAKALNALTHSSWGASA